MLSNWMGPGGINLPCTVGTWVLSNKSGAREFRTVKAYNSGVFNASVELVVIEVALQINDHGSDIQVVSSESEPHN